MLVQISNLKVSLDAGDEAISAQIRNILQISEAELLSWQISRKNIDARKRSEVHFVCTVECELASQSNPALSAQAVILKHSRLDISKPAELIKSATRSHIVVVGAGPAGIFAALALIEAGKQVTLLERGKPVETRMRDIGRLRSRGELNTESNICFGEGGAGTYTDGKLYTRIKHPFVRWVLAEFVRFGAREDILVDAHPHLGTDRLVKIIKNMRHHLISLGVDYRFETRVDALLFNPDRNIAGVRTAAGEEIAADDVILAIGHSARDTFEHLQATGIKLEAKAFAVGVRSEHEQEWVNHCQFGAAAKHPALGAAEYSLTHQVSDPYLGKRGVFSFCMCPGGLIVPSPTEHGMMAINGMSNAKRSSPLANSGIVVQVTPEDIKRHGLGDDPLCGIRMQRELERKTFDITNQPYAAPAMRVADFIADKQTGKLALSRFKPGAEAIDLRAIMPEWLSKPLAQGLIAFDRKMKGFVSEHANLLAIESRTSSPVRISREQDMQATDIKGLYPVGEGAGYAGGIVSAAVDGLKAASRIINK